MRIIYIGLFILVPNLFYANRVVDALMEEFSINLVGKAKALNQSVSIKKSVDQINSQIEYLILSESYNPDLFFSLLHQSRENQLRLNATIYSHLLRKKFSPLNLKNERLTYQTTKINQGFVTEAHLNIDGINFSKLRENFWKTNHYQRNKIKLSLINLETLFLKDSDGAYFKGFKQDQFLENKFFSSLQALGTVKNLVEEGSFNQVVFEEEVLAHIDLLDWKSWLKGQRLESDYVAISVVDANMTSCQVKNISQKPMVECLGNLYLYLFDTASKQLLVKKRFQEKGVSMKPIVSEAKEDAIEKLHLLLKKKLYQDELIDGSFATYENAQVFLSKDKLFASFTNEQESQKRGESSFNLFEN